MQEYTKLLRYGRVHKKCKGTRSCPPIMYRQAEVLCIGGGNCVS